MSDSPSTMPVPLSPHRPRRVSLILLGLVIHALCVVIACFGVPLVMNSNIWPIAGIFGSAMSVPVAAGTGALAGWLVKNAPPRMATLILIVTGILVAVAVGVVMANNR